MKVLLGKTKDFFFRRPIWSTLVYSALAALFFGTLAIISNTIGASPRFFFEGLISSLIVSFLFALPAILTIENTLLIFTKSKDEPIKLRLKIWELAAISVGGLFSLLWLAASNIQFSDWYEQLQNAQRHTPINTGAALTIGVILFLAAIAYLILSFSTIDKLPPLFAVICIAALYLGMGVCLLWCIQIFDITDMNVVLLCILPFNLFIIGIRTVRDVVEQQAFRTEGTGGEEFGDGIPDRLKNLHRLLNSSRNWPWLAFIAAIPLLGIITAVLILFGQEPDSFIKAWTETADWNMSQKIAPQNIYIDEHYLCTVAAGGHRTVVKPIRVGKRHGHRVLVNRQLSIANAFEQLLEERTPNFHRFIRGLYDKTGYPIAKHIKSPYMADVIYIMMKPLEWAFLTCLYLFDIKPENRIAVQYPHDTTIDKINFYA